MAVELDDKPCSSDKMYSTFVHHLHLHLHYHGSSADKKAILPDQWLANKPGFLAEETFSFDGHAFWADLMYGVLFCRCSDLLSPHHEI
uniref:Uncharacterized protein n=1 Tax=Leersia perrieri TaxID=77586 RepID=A0A0D9VZU7_9ORYZ